MGDNEEHTIAEDLVVTKYKMAGEIVNREYGRRGKMRAGLGPFYEAALPGLPPCLTGLRGRICLSLLLPRRRGGLLPRGAAVAERARPRRPRHPVARGTRRNKGTAAGSLVLSRPPSCRLWQHCRGRACSPWDVVVPQHCRLSWRPPHAACCTQHAVPVHMLRCSCPFLVPAPGVIYVFVDACRTCEPPFS